MYLSRIELNMNRRETMSAIASPHLMHGSVESCFGDYEETRQRNLWRIDWLKGTCYLMVLSTEQPDFTQFAAQFGDADKPQSWETKDYTPLLKRLKTGDTWRFRLRSNPTRSSTKEKSSASERGKVFAHVTQEQQRQWLLKRAESCGFALKEDQFDVVHTEWKKFTKGQQEKRQITLRTATYEGILTINDAEVFKETLIFGTGRGKAYGCGLLTITR